MIMIIIMIIIIIIKYNTKEKTMEGVIVDVFTCVSMIAGVQICRLQIFFLSWTIDVIDPVWKQQVP